MLALGATMFGPCYAAGLLAFLVVVRHGGEGLSPRVATVLVFLPLVTTWLCDTFAMTGGSVFGGPKLAPLISPHKTWSGAVSGLVGAGVVAVLYGALVLSAVGTPAPWPPEVTVPHLRDAPARGRQAVPPRSSFRYLLTC